jgi:F0F1-type ATP synthase assembly protein I
VLIGSFVGMLTAAFFLSRSYNAVLYLLVGLAFALYEIARRGGHSVHLPSLYRVSRKVAVMEFASIAAIYVLVRVNRLFVS